MSAIRNSTSFGLLLVAGISICATEAVAESNDVQPSVAVRWATETSPDETPSFRRHVAPLLGKLGCNGRACHGSFQGQGGFQLSLFGYDFEFDHEQLAGGEEPRVDVEDVDGSLVLMKPTLEIPHDGGHVLQKGSWQYRVLHRWIDRGAPSIADDEVPFSRLEITPAEIVAEQKGQTIQLRAVAVWENGDREDVTDLCRFHTNDDQIATINEDGKVAVVGPGDSFLIVSYDGGVESVPVMLPVTELVGNSYPDVPTPTRIDELVVQKLSKLGIVPSERASDVEFLRRVSLDMTGTLPTPAQVRAFIADDASDKRSRKIDELLETPAYAAWWATRLCDWTGNNSDGLNNVGLGRTVSSQEWYDWVRDRVTRNVPYDELVEGIVTATSRAEGQSLEDYFLETSSYYHKGSDEKESFSERESMPHYWARSTFRKPDDRALGFAYNFLGIRIQCAQCHKHPFDVWTKDDFAQFTGFFGNVSYGRDPRTRKEFDRLAEQFGLGNTRGNQARRERAELVKKGKPAAFEEVFVTPARKGNGKNKANGRRPAPQSTAKLLGSDIVELTEYDDARLPLMEWLKAEDNPYFAKAFVNRVWAGYFNVGIVDPPDDLSLGNPPSNTALLDYLAREFIKRDFDMKWLHREIANSATYQTSWTPNETNRGDQRNFSHAIPRRLPAEVAFDVLRQATGSDQLAEKMLTSIDDRAIALAEAGARTQQNRTGYAMQIFGRSNRDSNCDCDRSYEPSLLQTIYLQNDAEVLDLLGRSDSWLSQLDKTAVRGRRDRGDSEVASQKQQKIEQAIERIEAQIRRLKANGDKERVKKLEQALAKANSRLETIAPANPPAETGPSSELPATNELVALAYLRTVSRLPDAEEQAAATEFVESAPDRLEGTRDLLWALINTKEFIVNH